MDNKKLRIAVITDLHYVKDGGSSPKPEVCSNGNKIDPMERLSGFLSKGDFRGVDLVMCPGDITTKACVESFTSGWGDLNRLTQSLGAEYLIASTGNHEIISRSAEINKTPGNVELHVDPQEHLLQTKNYPTVFTEAHQRWVYWGRGYETLVGENWIVLIVNSCHFHTTQLANEFERGRVGESALEEMKQNLKDVAEGKAFRFVLIHHPPNNHEEPDVELGREPMFNGIKFLRILEDTGLDWLVIHGHKHFQRLVRIGDSDRSPMIFGAGSFGAGLKGAVATKTKNQFYIIDLEVGLDAIGEERLKASFNSFYWDLTEWKPVVDETQGLPNFCGFDLSKKIDIPQLAVLIRDTIPQDAPWCTWAELKAQIKALSYLTPSDIKSLKLALGKLKVKGLTEQHHWFPEQLSLQ
ncbi:MULTISPECIES: metallophosphoesterase family protein [Pseudomonas]|uniref:Metallophosphoesterase n=1 Tax=Pseudomonas aphyarum TaxID=2942629 RepID=A0ABT5PUZ7_9PSED|nr:metallophosphoesterase [Pseudomonas aphyarum]MDD0968073.1 metallophosphoesterase [Pseudomonas aphyarum]MDD1127595.1 metallophosphoesterase [Pseudomonas aphyarum]